MEVSFDVITPEKYKKQASDIEYGFHKSPFGTCLICVSHGKICYLAFLNENERKTALSEAKESWHYSKFIEDNKLTKLYVEKLFNSSTSKKTDFKLLLKGTDFQINVWKTLLSIPHGKLLSYESVAKKAGNVKATRAVASAIARNLIAYIIPCHRVIRKSGKIGKYRWGSKRKQAMHLWEKAV